MTVLRLKTCVILNVDPPPIGSPTRPYVALESVETGTGTLRSGADLSIRSPDAPGVSAAEPGDVLFGKLRPYLAKSLLVAEPLLASNELLCLRPREAVDSKWFSYVVLSKPFVDWAVATSDGVKMPRTSWEKLSEYRLTVPRPAKQQAIAYYLDAETSRIDGLIAKKRRMAELVEARRGAAIEAMIRSLDHVHGEAPLKRVVKRVEVGIVVTPAAWYADEGVLAIRGLNVGAGRITLDDVVRLSPEGHRLNRKSELHAGDVVVVRTGKAGAAAVVPPELDGSNCIDLVIVRPSRTFAPEFLAFVLNSDWTQKRIEEHAVGSIQSHFNVGAMREVPVPRAPLDVQLETVGLLGDLTGRTSRVISKLERQIDLLVEHRQALITAAVTGEIDISGVAG
jgi:type I restriction enzyme S subunit